MIRILSLEMCTSVETGYMLPDFPYGMMIGVENMPVSMPSAPSLMAASKLARVFSGRADEACVMLFAMSDPWRQMCHTPRCPQHSGRFRVDIADGGRGKDVGLKGNISSAKGCETLYSQAVRFTHV
jgi:hypothetical protein